MDFRGFLLVAVLFAFALSGTVQCTDLQINHAVSAGDFEMVKALINAGHPVDALGESGLSPLHDAAVLGSAEIARVLIDAGAEVDGLNVSGRTPLHLAAGSGHLDVVLLLASFGADLRIADGSGFSASQLARQSGHKKIAEVLDVLSGSDADVDHTESDPEDSDSSEWIERVQEMMASSEGELSDEQLGEFREAYGYGDDVSDEEVTVD